MASTRDNMPARKLRFAVDCDTTDQVLDFLALAKRHDLAPHMGNANNGFDFASELAARPAVPAAADRLSSSKNGPQKYPPNLMVRIGERPAEGSVQPRVLKLFDVLKAEFTDQPFRKGSIKSRLRDKKLFELSTGTGLVTRLIETDGLVIVSGRKSNVRVKSKQSKKANGARYSVSKPKRYPATMMVKVGEEPAPGTVSPTAIKVLKSIQKQYGDKPFRKGDAKQGVLRRLKLNSTTSYITQLMDVGALKPAAAA